MAKRIEILWTGGLDSTFMLCLLAREHDAVIQPYYLEIERSVQKDEHYALRHLYDRIKAKGDLKATILSVKHVKQKYFMPSDDVTESYRKFAGEPYTLGDQQRYLAEFAKNHKGLCWGQEPYFENPGHITRLLLEKGKLKVAEDGFGSYLDKSDSDPDVYRLFGNLRCPIYGYSNPAMWKKICEWGYEDVFRYIRFCYFPIDGKPCGFCHKCDEKIRQDMGFLFTDAALKRNKVYRSLKGKDNQENIIFISKWGVRLEDLFWMYVSPVYREYKYKFFLKRGTGEQFLKKLTDTISLYASYFDSLLEKA